MTTGKSPSPPAPDALKVERARCMKAATDRVLAGYAYGDPIYRDPTLAEVRDRINSAPLVDPPPTATDEYRKAVDALNKLTDADLKPAPDDDGLVAKLRSCAAFNCPRTQGNPMTNPDTKALREALAKATLKNNWWIDGASDGIVDLVELVVNALPALLDRSDELDRVTAASASRIADCGEESCPWSVKVSIRANRANARADAAEAELDRVRADHERQRLIWIETNDAALAALATAMRERDEARQIMGVSGLHSYQHSDAQHLIKPRPGRPICEWAALELAALASALATAYERGFNEARDAAFRWHKAQIESPHCGDSGNGRLNAFHIGSATAIAALKPMESTK